MHSAHESDLTLEGLQRWFLTEISGAPGLEAPQREVEEVVRPSQRMTAPERLAVYREMYSLRLHEALADDYPGVRALLGSERFDDLAGAYFAARPPHSFTLAHAGRYLPEFLERARGYGGVAVREVARFELALTEAFDAPATPRLRVEDLAGVSPDLWPLARFHVTGGFRLLASQVDVHRVLDAAAEGESAGAPEPGPTYSVVWRRDYVVWRKEITQTMYRTLEALAAGRSIADAVAAAVESWNGDEDSLAERIFAWFGEWLEEGFFSDVVVPKED